jgi:hypothetical protein
MIDNESWRAPYPYRWKWWYYVIAFFAFVVFVWFCIIPWSIKDWVEELRRNRA